MASLPNGTTVAISSSMYVDVNGKNISRSDIDDKTWTITDTVEKNGTSYYVVTNENNKSYTIRTSAVTKTYTYTEPPEETKNLYKDGDITKGYIDYVKLKSDTTTNVNGKTINNDVKDNIWSVKSVLDDEVTLYNSNDGYLTVKTSQVSETKKPKTSDEILSDVVEKYNNTDTSNKVQIGTIIKGMDNTYEVDGTEISDHSKEIDWIVSSVNIDGSVTLKNNENDNNMTVKLINGHYTLVGETDELKESKKAKKEKMESLFIKDSNVDVGDLIMIDNLVDYNGKKLSENLSSGTYRVIQVGGENLSDDRIVIGDANGNVIAAIKADNLKKLKSYDSLSISEKLFIDTEQIHNLSESMSDLAQSVLYSNLFGSELYEHDPGFKDPDNEDILANLSYTPLNGSAVQVLSDKLPATGNNEPEMAISDGIPDTGNMFGYDTEYDSISNQLTNDVTGIVLKDDMISKIERNDPEIAQNAYNYPTIVEYDPTLNLYKYDYSMNYEADGLLRNIDTIRKSVNIDVMSRSDLARKYTTYYNRFKLENPNDHLRKSFAHIFFVRPDLNIFKPGEPAATDLVLPSLNEGIAQEANWYYASKHTPEILRQLTQTQAGYDHEFMMLLSNKAKSFELSDEFIEYDAYGKTLTGYQIAYGKSNIGSKTNKQFSITYTDNNLLHIYNTHKLWTDYISDVFRGKYYPKTEYIYNKIIDYATCVYYFLTAEDGETILFWSKYWGVFPNNAPSSPFSFQPGNPGGVHHPELTIEYCYSFKEDFNPFTIIEFNNHGDTKNLNYVRPYNPDSLGTGYTWVGAPFVETFNGDASLEIPYTYKLRFRPNPELNYSSDTLGVTNDD